MMIRKRTISKQTPQDSRRGVAALEAAVVTPMLLILVLGTIEMGTALRASTIMQSAVREAGRLANMDWQQVIGEGDTPNEKLERDLGNFIRASGLNTVGEDENGDPGRRTCHFHHACGRPECRTAV